MEFLRALGGGLPECRRAGCSPAGGASHYEGAAVFQFLQALKKAWHPRPSPAPRVVTRGSGRRSRHGHTRISRAPF